MADYAVILAGGIGKRFWPASRQEKPKQFLPIIGDKPMIRQTTERIEPLIPAERILIVTSAEYLNIVQNILPEVPVCNILLEPEGRNTAPSVAWAAAVLQNRDPDATMAILASDHFIDQPDVFRCLLADALRIARTGNRIVTLGITPSRPETGYGYLRIGESSGSVEDRQFFSVERFVEKPDYSTALEYLSSGRYLWNSGMFVFRANGILDAFKKLQPDIYSGVRQIAQDPADADQVRRIFPRLPSISIDYAIMEQTSGIIAFPVDFTWADVGGWAALYDRIPGDTDGNRLAGNHCLIECENVLAHGRDSLIAALGLKDVIIVSSGSAVLVVHRSMTEKVGDIHKLLTSNDAWAPYV